MNRILKKMQEVTMDPRPMELVRNVSAQMLEEACKLCTFDDLQMNK